MAKKILSFCTVMMVCGAALFAQAEEIGKKSLSIFSAGLGGSFLTDFSSYLLTDAGKDALDEYETQIGGGFFVFVDAKYVELDLGMSFLNGDSVSTTNFEIQLIGTYPFAAGNRLTMRPLIGVDFKIALAQASTLLPAGLV
jgi:hypothetical protein